jgi:glutamine cyclotransferase
MNIYRTNRIVLVDNKPSSSGKVVQSWDMSDLVKQNKAAVGDDPTWKERLNVLNGIAYHEPTDTFVIGGKDWELIFFVKLNINV